MDELILSGKKYISSKRASALTGYAKDYIGQLARSGKIAATRVGRSWYVDESELLVHEGSGSIDQSLLHDSHAHRETTREAQAIVPAVHYPHGRTFRSVSHALAIAPRDFQKTWSSVQYFKDESALLPLFKGIEEVSTKINPHTDKKISDNRENTSVRIRILKNTLVTKKTEVAMGAHKALSSHAQSYSKAYVKTKHTSSPFSEIFMSPKVIGGVAAIGVLFISGAILASGLFISSHITISEYTGAYTANALFSYQHAQEVASASNPILKGGINALSNFFSLMFASFGTFFSIGFQFLLGLLHLV